MNLQVRGVWNIEVSLCSLAGGNGGAVAVIRRGPRPRGDLRTRPSGLDDSNSMKFVGRALRESRGHRWWVGNQVKFGARALSCYRDDGSAPSV